MDNANSNNVNDIKIALLVVIFIISASIILSYSRMRIQQPDTAVSQMKDKISQLELENSLLRIKLQQIQPTDIKHMDDVQ